MSRIIPGWWLAAAVLSVLALVACSQEQPPQEASTATVDDSDAAIHIKGAGATFPQPLYKRWIALYREQHPEIAITYEGVGSGEGIRRFLAEAVDFGASDAAMSDTDLAKVGERGALMIPMTAGMVVLAYNVPGVEDGLRLPRALVADIFAGKVSHWDDPRIEAANPGVTLPHRTITPVVRRDSSGTTFVLTNHLGAAHAWWAGDQGPGIGKQIDWPGNTMAVNYNEGVAQRVKTSEGTIGYMEYEFADRLGLPIAILENQAGQFVAPSPSAGTAALASADAIPDDLRVFVPDPPGMDAYPIVSYTWLLLYERYPDAAKRAALQDAVRWGLTEGQSVAEEMGYIPLPEQMVALAQARVERID
jgi:phosphate transport system substrate-binding protein